LKNSSLATRTRLRWFNVTVGASRYIGIKLTIPEKSSIGLHMFRLIGIIAVIVGIYWLGDHYGFAGIENLIEGVTK